MSKKPFLSPSSLGTFKDCPKCFWQDKILKIGKPRGPFPSLPGGVDEVMKAYHDAHRSMMATPEMEELLPGATLYADQENLNRWRNWRSGLKAEGDTFVVGGAFDDLIVEGGLFSPFDFKTKGTEPDQAYGEKYYQTQLDVYAYMLAKNGMPLSGRGHLLYLWPVSNMTGDGVTFDGATFQRKFLTLQVSTQRAEDLMNQAAACLSLPVAPPPKPECEFCAYASKVRALK